MISKELQVSFSGFLHEFASAEKKIEVFRSRLNDLLTNNREF